MAIALGMPPGPSAAATKRRARPAPVSIEEHLERSWSRCRLQYALERNEARTPAMVHPPELQRRRKHADSMFAIARVEMARLSRMFEAPVGVMLTDADGVILSYAGAPGFADLARHAGLREGAVWSEEQQGTNGMGTCLAACGPIVVRQGEHYLVRNDVLSCFAAPIMDGRGCLQGTLNISAPRPLAPAPTIALVELAVRGITDRAFLENHRAHHLLRFHPKRPFVTTAGEALLAVDPQGLVAGANEGALAWFGAGEHTDLCGHLLQDVAGVGLDQLDAIARRGGAPLWLDAISAYGVVHRPVGSTGRSSNSVSVTTTDPVAGSLANAERDAIHSALQANDWNVTAAARALAISRRTLHRKIRRHGLHAVSGT